MSSRRSVFLTASLLSSGDTAGNLNPWEKDPEGALDSVGDVARLGVAGAVRAPDCGLVLRSGRACSLKPGEKEDSRRGEGCVVERWPSGAIFTLIDDSIPSISKLA